MSEKIVKSDQEWSCQLSPEEFRVTRQHGTERPFANRYWNSKERGTYACVCCGQPLFKSDMVVQGERLMKMIGVAVGLLGQPQTLIPALQQLGRRHADYGVRDEHYDTVGTALLTTLQQGIGVAFTPEVREAWVEVYGVVSRTMKEAARVPA